MRTTAALLFLCLTCLPQAARAEDAPPASERPVPLEMTVRRASATLGYGTPLRLTIRFHNPSKTRTAKLWWDRRSDGVLAIELVDDDGLVWRPLQQAMPLPVIQLQPYQRAWQSPFVQLQHPQPLVIAPASFVDLPFAFDQAVLVDPPAAHRAGRWLRPLPPGRYRVRATYVKENQVVPSTPTVWHPRLIQLQPASRGHVVPGLWTGRLQASARVEVVAPRTDDVDALRARIRTLETRNAAMRKQLDAIREILRGG